jgi:hypothetical protein
MIAGLSSPGTVWRRLWGERSRGKATENQFMIATLQPLARLLQQKMRTTEWDYTVFLVSEHFQYCATCTVDVVTDTRLWLLPWWKSVRADSCPGSFLAIPMPVRDAEKCPSSAYALMDNMISSCVVRYSHSNYNFTRTMGQPHWSAGRDPWLLYQLNAIYCFSKHARCACIAFKK